MSLTRLQATCILGNVVGLGLLFQAFVAPFWVFVYAQSNGPKGRFIAIGPVTMVETYIPDDGNVMNLIIRIVQWDSFAGEIPVWANAGRLLMGFALIVLTVTCLLNSVFRITHMIAGGLLSLVSGGLSTVALVLFATNSGGIFLKYMGGPLETALCFYLAIVATFIILGTGVLSFFARIPKTQTHESVPIVINRTGNPNYNFLGTANSLHELHPVKPPY